MKFEDYMNDINKIDYFGEIDYEDNISVYDFHELQELLYSDNQTIFIVGTTKIDKTKMMGSLIRSLVAGGTKTNNILILDYHLIELFKFDVFEFIRKIYSNFDGKSVYLFINEIHFMDNWQEFLILINTVYKNIKLVCTSSAAPEVYENLIDKKLEFCKIIVLSEKNSSNIKSVSNGSGIYEYLKYNIKEDYIEIKGLIKDEKHRKSIEIPQKIDGKIVKVISSGAFHDRQELEKIKIPDTIKMIGDYAFTKCISLTSIEFPQSLEYIGENAFMGSKNLINISGGDNVKHIGNCAFFGTRWFEENQNKFIIFGKVLYKYNGTDSNIIIPSNISEVTNWAFSHNKFIKSVSIQNDSCIISEGTFYKCINLEKIEGLNGNIESFVFAYCNSLTNINLNHPKIIGDYSFFNCKKISKISIDSTIIGMCAFASCKRLQKIIGAPKIIEKSGFQNCISLNEINLELTIFIGAFSLFNTAIRQLNINSDYIGDYSFANIKELSLVRINSKTKISKSIFGSNISIVDLSIGGRYPISYYFDHFKTTNISTIRIEDDFIVDNILRGYLPLKTLYLSNIKKPGKWTFYKCQNLEKVVINEGITEIGDWAFMNCKMLHEIELPKSIKKIGMNAFRYCINLKMIQLNSDNIVQFSVNAFYDTHATKKFRVPRMLLNEYMKDKRWKDYQFILEGF